MKGQYFYRLLCSFILIHSQVSFARNCVNRVFNKFMSNLLKEQGKPPFKGAVTDTHLNIAMSLFETRECPYIYTGSISPECKNSWRQRLGNLDSADRDRVKQFITQEIRRRNSIGF